jgi:Na+-translocating ferredoxin:NAD+ oxidoreductase RnfC subunit
MGVVERVLTIVGFKKKVPVIVNKQLGDQLKELLEAGGVTAENLAEMLKKRSSMSEQAKAARQRGKK